MVFTNFLNIKNTIYATKLESNSKYGKKDSIFFQFLVFFFPKGILKQNIHSYFYFLQFVKILLPKKTLSAHPQNIVQCLNFLNFYLWSIAKFDQVLLWMISKPLPHKIEKMNPDFQVNGWQKIANKKIIVCDL